ncbi:hypothetical protein Aargi30884_06360 [Amedibacterium intestinale]|uniref:N-acetyltransferase domain-containing protein n=1 Tax=Amedibacterium intestinale TaxID=2583452 RepID=A0A6N4TG41_9FIRM|nr:GNAT family N-acetyltransferase [Amedibacterium intestinale]BBK21733.1 hypothetical protein Aargi30884_06360 [Amedibacterium intestinale]
MEIANFNNFEDRVFCQVFKKYFEEIQVHVEDWDALFKDMNADERDVAKVLMEDGKIYGFIIYRKDELKNWFFCETIGFIREFWISKSMRKQGFGSKLLEAAEKDMEDVNRIMLTPAKRKESFYEKRGYRKAKIQALNCLHVYVKER